MAPSARVVSNLQERRLRHDGQRAAAGPSGDLGRVPRGAGGQGGSRGGRGGHVVLIAKSATAILWPWRVAIAVENIDFAVVGSHGAGRARPASHSLDPAAAPPATLHEHRTGTERVENIDVAVVGSHGAERACPASHSWR